jgi:hypothetical protein
LSLVTLAAVMALAVLVVVGWRSVAAQNSQTRQQVDALVQQATALQSDVAEAATDLAELASQLDEVQTALDTTQRSLVATSGQVATIGGQVQSLDRSVKGAVTQIGTLDKNVALLQQENDSARKRSDATALEVAGLSSDVTRLTDGLSKLETQVTTLLARSGIGQPTAAASALKLDERTRLSLEPVTPFAGQDVRFTVQGLEPWEQVRVALVGPDGVPVEWVTEDEAYLVGASGQRVREITRYADQSGTVNWTRVGTRDGEGTWKARVTVDGASKEGTYQLAQLQLPTTTVRKFGMDLRLYQGVLSDVQFTAGVPTSLVLDLQGHLKSVRTKLAERAGLRDNDIPDLYLFADRRQFEAAGRSVGVPVTNEAGFYLLRSQNTGIYISAAEFSSTLRDVLTHEYAHRLLDERAPSVSLPAWFNEGSAAYFEIVLGLEKDRPAPTRKTLYSYLDLAQRRLQQNTLFSLPALETQRVWNGRSGEDSTLQYAQAQMAVRYLVETYGMVGWTMVLDGLAARQTIAAAIQAGLGVSYGAFETAYRVWLRDWKDAERESARSYYTTASRMMSQRAALTAERNAWLASNNNQLGPRAELMTQQWLATAQRLASEASALTPPATFASGHQALVGMLGRTVDWLRLESEYVRSREDSNRLQANAMVPEINARASFALSALWDLGYDYTLR